MDRRSDLKAHIAYLRPSNPPPPTTLSLPFFFKEVNDVSRGRRQEEELAFSNPTTSHEAQLYHEDVVGVLEMCTPSISSMQPVTTNAAEDDRKGKQALVHPSPF